MSMQTSMFAQYIDKYFKGIVGKVTELWNGRKDEPDFLYEEMLDKEYSSDLTWNSASMNHSIVAADVVSMDSSLPLKKRGTLRLAAGDIAKIGIKYKLNEKSISDIQVMAAKGQKEADIARKILNNVPRAIRGVKVRLEIMFQQALSTGFVLVDNEINDGTGVRADFGFDAAKNFHALGAAWSDASNATPLTDLRQMFDAAAANGDEINDVYMSELYFNYARKSAEVKELVATANNQVIISAATLPQPSRSKTLDAFADEFNATFHIVNSSFKVEAPDGSQTTIKPWAQGNVIGVQGVKVGRLVHGTLAEDSNRVAGVTYAKSDFILVSEYSHNEPSLEEFTAAQALAMPVIDDGNYVYMLNADATAPLVVDPDELAFLAAGGSKTSTVVADEDLAVSVSVANDYSAWLSASYSKRTGKVTVTATANTGSSAVARTGKVVVKAGDNEEEIAVSQAA